MSWIEKIKNDLIITLGDGSEFRPLWMNAVKTKGYNITEFEFPNINGTLVSRTTSKGGRFNLELYFQGEDHLDVSSAFEQSAEDSRPWTIIHPFYGTMIVQPSELSFDNTSYNFSKITGTVIETIIDNNPKTTIKAEDNIAVLKESNDAQLIESFDETPAPADASFLTDQLNKYYKEGGKIQKTQEQAQEYFNKYNTALAAINKIAALPQEAMQAVQAVIKEPLAFIADVKSKVSGVSDQFKSLKNSVNSVSSKISKEIYSINGSSILTTQAQATVTQSTENVSANGESVSSSNEIVLTRKEVFALAEDLLNNYNDFIVTLDSLQTENNGTPESFIPDFESYIQLNAIISAAITGLFSLARNSRQERTIFLENDTDLINLTHRLYGLDQSDLKMNELQIINSIGLNDLLELKKGSKIIYYI